jgi:peptide/nickel transport system permease protein
MGRYLIRRALFMVLVIIIVSFLTFVIFVKLPAGDPARRAVGRTTTPEQIENARRAFGLDKPLYVQYWRFLKGFIPWPGLWLNEDVYYSYDGFIPVKEELARRIPITGVLAIGAAAIWLLLGIPIGILSAIKRGSFADRAAMIFAIIGVSMPIFWLAQLLLYVFWYQLELLPPAGIPIGYNGWTGAIRAALEGRFILPWISLAYINAAFYARMVRGNLIETMSEDYIRTARAKGVFERLVVSRHALRNALLPAITVIGLEFTFLIGGLVVTEQVFNLNGIGKLFVQSVSRNDFTLIQGMVMLIAVFYVFTNLVIDLLYALFDPRIRYG